MVGDYRLTKQSSLTRHVILGGSKQGWEPFSRLYKPMVLGLGSSNLRGKIISDWSYIKSEEFKLPSRRFQHDCLDDVVVLGRDNHLHSNFDKI